MTEDAKNVLSFAYKLAETNCSRTTTGENTTSEETNVGGAIMFSALTVEAKNELSFANSAGVSVLDVEITAAKNELVLVNSAGVRVF